MYTINEGGGFMLLLLVGWDYGNKVCYGEISERAAGWQLAGALFSGESLVINRCTEQRKAHMSAPMNGSQH